MIVIVGAHSDEEHPDSKEIGYKNWQAYEIAQNHEKCYDVVIVKYRYESIISDEIFSAIQQEKMLRTNCKSNWK